MLHIPRWGGGYTLYSTSATCLYGAFPALLRPPKACFSGPASYTISMFFRPSFLQHGYVFSCPAPYTWACFSCPAPYTMGMFFRPSFLHHGHVFSGLAPYTWACFSGPAPYTMGMFFRPSSLHHGHDFQAQLFTPWAWFSGPATYTIGMFTCLKTARLILWVKSRRICFKDSV